MTRATLYLVNAREESRPIENEAKLVASADVVLPSLEGLTDHVIATTAPQRQLDATYYDTAALDLIRFGVTLRHRSGEGAGTWTVKLPEQEHGQVLQRSELNFKGDEDQVPDDVRDLVTAYLRSRPLEPVAHLQTTRTPIELRGRDGFLLEEVVDDAVRASGPRCVERQFREIEIESHLDTEHGNRLLRATVTRLIEAGCREERPIPKVSRVLGTAALEPPEVVAPVVTPESSVDVLFRHTVARSVLQLLRHDPRVRLGGDPEDVHQLRVAVRRLRSDLRSFAAFLDGTKVTALRAELAWLGNEVGRMRDCDVLTDRLRARSARCALEEQSGIAMLLAHLDAIAVESRRSMLAALQSDRYVRLLDSLVQTTIGTPMTGKEAQGASRPGAPAVVEIVRHRWHRLADAVDRLDADSSDETLHRLRILTKRCRYAADASTPIFGQRAARFAAAIAKLQDLLGEYHDAVVTQAWLRDAAVTLPDARKAAGELICLERLEREQFHVAWPAIWAQTSARKLRRWF